MCVWTRFMCFRMVRLVGSLELGNELSVCMYLSVAERLVTSRKGL